MLILQSSYLPPISYFAELVRSQGNATIDIGEHYIKRSIRNRTRLMTAQGVIELTIPVKRANRPCSVMATMEIDNSKRWQHQHWVTILSAYKSSPYFDHYAPYLEPLYRREWSTLVEFNEALMRVIYRLLQLSSELQPTISTDYITAQAEDRDLRAKGATAETAKGETAGATEGLAEYMQVFAERLDFVPNLSILDLLMCEGSAAMSYLQGR